MALPQRLDATLGFSGLGGTWPSDVHTRGARISRQVQAREKRPPHISPHHQNRAMHCPAALFLPHKPDKINHSSAATVMAVKWADHCHLPCDHLLILPVNPSCDSGQQSSCSLLQVSKPRGEITSLAMAKKDLNPVELHWLQPVAPYTCCALCHLPGSSGGP